MIWHRLKCPLSVEELKQIILKYDPKLPNCELASLVNLPSGRYRTVTIHMRRQIRKGFKRGSNLYRACYELGKEGHRDKIEKFIGHGEVAAQGFLDAGKIEVKGGK